MSEALLKEKFDELKLTEDEVNRFTEALKKEEFRKLLVEYAQEISDPENRKLYEKEIEQLENERGVDVTFINPEPGFVLKTTQNGDLKCFINICMNKNVKPPTSEITSKKDPVTGLDKKGMTWSIPHSCSPGRDDLDKSGKKCIVYDVVFHPDSYRMGETNKRFQLLIQDTAIETLENNFKVKIDKKNVKVLSMKFKGRPQATVIRKPKEGTEATAKNTEPQDDLMAKVKTPYKYPAEEAVPAVKVEETKQPVVKPEDLFEEPKYTIINRGHADIQDCANELKLVVNSTRPKELIVEIDLPLCKSAAHVKLDIFEKRLYLESQKPNYKLDLNLAYPVDENNGNAKFDKTKRKLVVTLPVIPLKVDFEEDSGQNRALIEPIEPSTELTPPNTPPPSEQEEESCADKTPGDKKVDDFSTIKHILADKYKFEQSSSYLKLKFFTKNFNEKSFTISLAAKSATLKFETVSNGGYVTYYSAYVAFDKDSIDFRSGYKVEAKSLYTDDEHVLIRLKKLNGVSIDKVLLSTDSKDANQTAVIVESCEDEEETTEPSQVKFTVGSTDRFNVNIQRADGQQLDEDDDQDVDVVVKSENEILKTVAEFNDSNEDENTGKNANGSTDSLENSQSSVEFTSTQSHRERRIKSILKKPRSYSEGESHHEISLLTQSSSSTGSGGSMCMENSLETISEKENREKKSVSFNQQIVKKVFKTNSSITDMNKPHTAKNRKRNQRRKRTISDPSHDGKDSSNNNKNRNRSTSESSDDGHHYSLTASSEEDLHDHGDDGQNNDDDDDQDENVSMPNDDSQQQKPTITEIQKKIMKEDGNRKQLNNGNTEETALSWGDGRNNKFIEKTKCAFKFTNKIMNELDD